MSDNLFDCVPFVDDDLNSLKDLHKCLDSMRAFLKTKSYFDCNEHLKALRYYLFMAHIELNQFGAVI